MLFEVNPNWLQTCPPQLAQRPSLYMNKASYCLWRWLGEEKYQKYVDNHPRIIRPISDTSADPKTTHIKTFIRLVPTYLDIHKMKTIKILQCNDDPSLAIVYCANTIDDYFLQTIKPYIADCTKLRFYAKGYDSPQINFEFSPSMDFWKETISHATSISLIGCVSAKDRSQVNLWLPAC